jgi:hypothetical protein
MIKNRRFILYICIFFASLSIVFLMVSYSFSHQMKTLYPMVLPVMILFFAISSLTKK